LEPDLFQNTMPFQNLPVKDVLDANRADFDAKRDAVDQARQKIAALLQADTIDQAQLESALGDMQARMAEMFQLGQKVMVDVALKLPPDLRKDWAKKWAEERRWKKSGRAARDVFLAGLDT